MNRLPATLWLATTLLVACNPPPPSPESRANQATLAACRQRADQVFRTQNRGALFTQDSLAAQSGVFNQGISNQGLSDRFSWDSQVADCVRSESRPAPPTPTPTMGP
ncbi:MAG: hypothetical protein FWD12_00075 [Alphaproteobacteria bacterium]|nr:hypothetical protein [Alphaproteobacteria bacterium]